MLRRLRTVDKEFQVWEDRGKGSHRMVVLGEKHYPFPCHNDGAQIGRSYLRDIIKFFDLPSDIFD